MHAGSSRRCIALICLDEHLVCIAVDHFDVFAMANMSRKYLVPLGVQLDEAIAVERRHDIEASKSGSLQDLAVSRRRLMPALAKPSM